jgi:dTDP-glucose 4,6-dehydratase
MKVLITGAGGFVGHHALTHLLNTTDWEFVATDSFNHLGLSARLRTVFEEVPEATKRVKVVTHDLSTPIDKFTASEFGKIDTIINYASNANVDESVKNPVPFVQNNINLALTMFEYARNLDSLNCFIQISTDEVYGAAKKNEKHSEWQPLMPSNPYSASKMGQEAIANAYWRTYNVPVIITNSMNIFGQRQQERAFVPKTIGYLLQNKTMPIHASLINKKWIMGSRHYLHARSQADAVKFLIEKFKGSNYKYADGIEKLERFNIIGETEIHNDDLVYLIANILKIKIEKQINKLNITDFTGKIIKEISDLTSNCLEINTSELNQGIYYLSIYSDDAVHIRKFVKE